MSGYQTYTRWQRIESQADAMGFRMGNPNHGWGSDNNDVVAIFPKDTELPTFSRDAEIFAGTFREVEVFLTGWARAQQYDMLLRMSDETKRKKYEDKERERQRWAKEREEQRKMWKILTEEDITLKSLEEK